MNKDLLFQLYGVFSPSGKEQKMRKFIKDYIKKNCGKCDVEQDGSGNLFIIKGQSETYPCLAAHIDQIQKTRYKDFTCLEVDDKVFGWSPKMMEQQGLGADDKNGIWICLECLKKYDVLKVAFFVGEEAGCVGSRACDMSFFEDCRFIVEPDRMGSSDLITDMFCGDVCSEDFVAALDAYSFGYEHDHGSVTDVGELVSRGVGISCLNVSCGYYRAHTDREYTCLPELENCLNFVCHIIETCVIVYPFAMEDKYFYSYGGYDDDDEYCDEDYEMMEDILLENSTLTFSDIIDMYSVNFFTQDVDILRDIYDATRENLGIEEEDELPFRITKVS